MNGNKMMIIVVLVIAMTLTGCAASGQASSTQAAPGGSGPQAGGTPGPAGRQGETPLALKLALGTLKLEGTPNAITAEQAAALLPLWKGARSLSNSQTAASEEVNAIFKQIEKAMTAEQLAAIDEMQIGMGDMQSVTQELGLELGGMGGASPEIQATMEAARATAQAGGQAPGEGGMGGPPGGGMGGPPGGGMMGGGPGMSDSGLSDTAKATAMAQRSSRGAQVGIPSQLIDAVVNALEAVKK